MKKHFFVLEDDPVQAGRLKEIITDYSAEIAVTIASTLDEALDYLLGAVSYHAFFLDISLSCEDDNEDGIILAKKIRSISQYKDTPIVFVTAFPQHVYKAVNGLHCFAYLMKPYQAYEVQKQLQELLKDNTCFTIRCVDGIYVRLPLDSIKYIYSTGRYITYVTTSSEYHSRQYNLREPEKLLPKEYIRCHKSYIINQAFIKNYDFTNRYVHMKQTSTPLPLSKKFHL